MAHEWDPSEYERAASLAVAAVAAYVGDSQAGERPAVSRAPLAEVLEELDLRRLLRDGGMDLEGFESWLQSPS